MPEHNPNIRPDTTLSTYNQPLSFKSSTTNELMDSLNYWSDNWLAIVTDAKMELVLTAIYTDCERELVSRGGVIE